MHATAIVILSITSDSRLNNNNINIQHVMLWLVYTWSFSRFVECSDLIYTLLSDDLQSCIFCIPVLSISI